MGELLVEKARALIPERKRQAEVARHRNIEYNNAQIHQRQELWEEQFARTAERLKRKEDEANGIFNYHDNRSLPKKVKTKGRSAKKKKGGKGGDEKKKKDAEEEQPEKELTEEEKAAEAARRELPSIKELWDEFDKDKGGSLDRKEVVNLLKAIW